MNTPADETTQRISKPAAEPTKPQARSKSGAKPGGGTGPAGQKKAAPVHRVGIVLAGLPYCGATALEQALVAMGCDRPRRRGRLALAEDAKTADAAPVDEPIRSDDIRNLHDDILALTGMDRFDWQPFDATWTQSPKAQDLTTRAVDVMKKLFGGSKLFVFSEPDIGRFLPFWKSVFDLRKMSPVVVHLHRNPLEFARIAAEAEGADPNVAQLVWLRHALETEAATRWSPRSFASYEMLVTNWAGSVEDMLSAMEVTLPRTVRAVAGEVEALFDDPDGPVSIPRNKAARNPLVPAWIRTTYAILERWAENGEDPADHKALDQMRAAFDDAGPNFAGLLEADGTAQGPAADEARAEAESARADLARLREEMAEVRVLLEARLDAAEDELDRLAGTAAADAATIARQIEDLARLTQEITERDTVIEAERETQNRQQVEAQLASERLAQKTAEVEALETQLAEAKKQRDADREKHIDVLALKTEEINTLEGRLESHFHELAELARLLSESESRAEKERTEAASKVETLTRAVEAQKTTAAATRTQLRDELEAMRASSTARIAELQGQLAAAITQAEEARSATKTVIQREREAAREREAILERKVETERAQVERVRAQGQEELAERQRENTAREKALNDALATERDRAEDGRRAAEALLAREREAAAAREAELARQLEAERARAVAAEAVVTAVRDSASWRMTAPVRKAVTLLRSGRS